MDKINRVKSKFRKFSNRPSLVHESKIRDWNGSLLFKSSVASSDKPNLARAFKDSAEMLSLPITINDPIIKKDLEEDLEDVRELMKKKKEEDLKKIREFIERTK